MDYAEAIKNQEEELIELKKKYENIKLNEHSLFTKDFYESKIKKLERSILDNKIFLQIEEYEINQQAAKEKYEINQQAVKEKSPGKIKSSVRKSPKKSHGGYKRHKRTRNKKRGPKRKSQKRFHR
jgi:hypothetical protein